MRRRLKESLFCLGFVALLTAFGMLGVASAQVREAWVARYNGPGNGTDFPTALAVDQAGNVYVTGWSMGAGAQEDYATVKYAPDGTQLWVQRYNANGRAGANALAVDQAGNVYVTGASWGAGTKWDFATVKYAPDGTQLWVQRYNGPGNDNDQARALAVDQAGNVYVTGESWGAGTLYDYATVKYAPDGTQLWVQRYNGLDNYSDQPTALAVDQAGNVYVTGRSVEPAMYGDYATVKYAPDGTQLWVQRYNGPANENDEATALAVDQAGNVYVTGLSLGTGTDYDYATVKYAPDGTQLWVQRYNGPANGRDAASAVAVDQAGNVYVTGASWGVQEDFATVKYAPDGTQLWVQRYDGPANGSDGARALAVDQAGNVYVTGWSGIYYYVCHCDYATVKYAPDGTQLGVQRYTGPGDNPDWANALAVDQAGNVYVTGQSTGAGTDFDYATVKYTPAPPDLPQLTLSLNGTSFWPGDTQILTATVTPGATPGTVDVYLAVRLPDGTLLFFPTFTRDLWPVLTSWPVAPFAGEVFRYTFSLSGGEPAGSYAWLGAFTEPGTLNFIGPIVSAPFSFSP